MEGWDDGSLLFIFLHLSPCLCKQSTAVEGVESSTVECLVWLLNEGEGRRVCVCVGLERAG